MKVAITGGAGFVGRHVAARLGAAGTAAENTAETAVETVIVSRRTGTDIDDVDALATAFHGVDVVAHCAGINREIGDQTYAKVHVAGTAAVVEAARRAGVRKVVMLSFLRARPSSGSPYHESKWQAEEIIRASGLDFTIVKAGMIYGRGDHLIDHLSRTVKTIPLFASVGFREKAIAPVPVDDLTRILESVLHEGVLTRSTVAVTGAEHLMLSEAVRRVARVVGRRVVVVPMPVVFHRVLGQVTEWTMRVPLVAKAQVRMLAEGVVEPAPLDGLTRLPVELRPTGRFTDAAIRAALPDEGRFTRHDLRSPVAG